LVAQAATREGKLALLGLFGLLLFLSTPLPLWSWTMAVLVATSLLPGRRRNLVTAGTLGTAILAGYIKYRPAGSSATSGPLIRGLVTYVAALTAILIFGLVLCTVAAKWPRSGVMNRPVLSLNILFAALAIAAAVTPLSQDIQSGVQFTVVLLAGYLWYFAYSLQDRLASDRDSAFHQIGKWAPFLGKRGRSRHAVLQGRRLPPPYRGKDARGTRHNSDQGTKAPDVVLRSANRYCVLL
jgi:hypothetical protein